MKIAFHIDEGALVLPDGAVDRSMNLLEWKIDGDPVQLTVQRDTHADRLSPAKLLAVTTSEYERRFPLFQSETAPALEIACDHAVAAFTWKKDHQAVYQAQVFIELGSRVLVLTASGRAKHRDAIVALIQGAVESMTVRT